jgi:NADH dehydrogenase (ubiquinone) 1 alpha subcomplex subunit 6
MYSLNMPVSRIRTRMRQEFERHRYVGQLPTVDVLLSKGQMEFQVFAKSTRTDVSRKLMKLQETMNYWKQMTHVLKYFAAEEGQATKLPQNFMSGFLEVC